MVERCDIGHKLSVLCTVVDFEFAKGTLSWGYVDHVVEPVHTESES